MKTKLRGERIGLMTVDPGRTTGVTISQPLLTGNVTEIFERDTLHVFQINCQDTSVPEPETEVPGTLDLLGEYQDAEKEWLDAGIPYSHHHLVIEDFILRGKLGGTERSGLSPVRVGSGLMVGLRLEGHKPHIHFQQASDAKGVATNERLKSWGLWTRGLEHGRDATRHAVLFVRRSMA